MKVLAAILILLVSNAAAAQECKTCSMADACIKAYLKATSEAQSATKQAIRDWKQNLDRKASAELSSRGTLALPRLFSLLSKPSESACCSCCPDQHASTFGMNIARSPSAQLD